MSGVAKLAIIGGTGLNTLFAEDVVASNEADDTPYGKTSGPVISSSVENENVLFLARHGIPHNIPPHRINYRSNIWALKQRGVQHIIAVNAVGGITDQAKTGCIVIPDQLIDYSYGREHTYSDGSNNELQHIDFTYPFSITLRDQVIRVATANNITVVDKGVYACVQGPRLETAAEINRLENDGCDLVGMTAMPEAALARELGIEYVSICLVVNPAAGRSNALITMEEIHQVIDEGMGRVRQLLTAVIAKKN